MSISAPRIESEGSKQLITLLDALTEGSLRVPRFQRDFVWERSKIVALLDSIFKEYPIGSFFLWETTGKHNLFYRDLPELGIMPKKPRSDEKLKFILDGQQRICSLYAAWKGLKVEIKHNNKVKAIDCSVICLDLDYYKKTPDENGNISVFEVKKESDRYLPLYKIIGEDHLSLYDKLPPERRKVFNDCYRRFTTYPLSVVTVSNATLNEACEIFERINQGGKKLSLFDLIVASTWGEDFDLKEKYEELSGRISKKNFGEIPPEVVTHTASLILKGYCNKIYQLQLRKEEIKNNWDGIASAIEQAIDHLTGSLGVKIFDFVPYPSFISLLAYLYYKSPRHSLDKEVTEKVHEWFWKASLSERYTAAMESKMGEDRREIFDKLLSDKEPKINFQITADEEKIANTTISTKSALRNAFFCMLALRTPKHFRTNEPISMDYNFCSEFNHPEKHHIFPKNHLSKHGQSGENLIANFCFIPAELNKEILDKSPSDYFSKFDKENSDFDNTLQSHLITYSEVIKNDDYQAFIKERVIKIKGEFERLTGSKIIQILGVNANSALDDIELRLRLLIDNVLRDKVGPDYWDKVIPQDIKVKAKTKIAEYVRKNPYIKEDQLSSYEKLCQCDVMDYSNTILKNWQFFEQYFGSTYETEKRFITLKDFRNAVKHVKEINFVLQKEAEAAVEWFSQILRVVKNIDKEEPEESKVALGRKIEPDEQTIKRVKSEFVKQAVTSIPEWVEKDFKDRDVSFERWAGSSRAIKISKNLVLYYYSAEQWIFAELQYTNPEELELLKDKLSKPESVMPKKRHDQVRFHLINNEDLEVVKEIIRKRVSL